MNTISSYFLCKVPINPTNQLTFENLQEQISYFDSKVIQSIPNSNYIKHDSDGKIKISKYYDNLENANYGYFINSYNGTGRRYYFWIVNRTFISKSVTELTIQIDVIQTWLFEFKINKCLVEREHVDNDDFGKHTFPENFEIGDYISYKRQEVAELKGNPCYIIGLTDFDETTIGNVYGKTYSGFTLRYYPYHAHGELSKFIKDLGQKGKADSIAFIFTFPDEFFKKAYLDNGIDIPTNSAGLYISGLAGVIELDQIFNNLLYDFTYDGVTYTPKNNKLLGYPFNFVAIKNPSGANVVLKLENFENSNRLKFKLESVLCQNPHITLTPLEYCGKAYAIEDSISLDSYGLCSWNNDNYANWFAQHHNSINAQSVNARNNLNTMNQVATNNFDRSNYLRDNALSQNVLNGVAGVIPNLIAQNPTGVASGVVGTGINSYFNYANMTRNANTDFANSNLMNMNNYNSTVRSLLASVQDSQIQPNTAKGSTATTGLDLARDTATFFIEQIAIKPEYFEIIDNYFQMYGYQVNIIKEPTFNNREKWDFIKTVNATFGGNIPREASVLLENIFNNGLTFWHDEKYMFDYSVENGVR